MSFRDSERYRKVYSYYRPVPRPSDPGGVSKEYVDEALRAMDWKQSVKYATTGTIDIATNGPAAIDGDDLLSDEDRILVKNQPAAAENGIYMYYASTNALARTLDATQDALTCGATVYVESGSVNEKSIFTLVTQDPITVGTTSQAWMSIIAGGGVPGSPLSSVQFNDGGSFGGSANFTYSKSPSRLFLTGALEQGESSRAFGVRSHAEGLETVASGTYSHAEGYLTVASGTYSHAEGESTLSVTSGSHAEGYGTVAGIAALAPYDGGPLGDVSPSVLKLAADYGDVTADFQPDTKVLFTNFSTYFFEEKIANSNFDGTYTYVTSSTSTLLAAPTYIALQNGYFHPASYEQPGISPIKTHAHAEGETTVAVGTYSHAEGEQTRAIGDNSHAEGSATTAGGYASHAEGVSSTSIGLGSHAEGNSSYAIGSYSHAEGDMSVSFGDYSHAGGIYTIASGSGQTTVGQYNLRGNDTSLFVVGDGTSDADADRHDLLRLNFGRAEVTGTLAVTGSFEVTGSSYLAGDVFEISGSLLVSGTSHFDGDVFITGSSIFAGDVLELSASLLVSGVTRIEGDLMVTGSVFSTAGFSGSLTTLADGSPYLLAGPNIAINTNSLGQVEVTGSAADVYWESMTLDAIFTTGSVAIMGGEAGIDAAEDKGADVFFYVSGSVNGVGTDDKKSVFGGDVKISGSLSQGENTRITAESSHAEGVDTWAGGAGSHAEGNNTIAGGLYTHTEGLDTYSTGNYAHAEGQNTNADGLGSHAEGYSTISYGIGSHTEGSGSRAYGEYSHAEGYNTIASGTYSHAAGLSTIASGSGQNVVGKYNTRDNDFSLFVVGDGSGDDNTLRHDVLRVNSGSVEVSGSFAATLGLSGSLTKLIDGTSYMVAGNSVLISSASNGSVTVSTASPVEPLVMSTTNTRSHKSILVSGSNEFQNVAGLTPSESPLPIRIASISHHNFYLSNSSGGELIQPGFMFSAPDAGVFLGWSPRGQNGDVNPFGTFSGSYGLATAGNSVYLSTTGSSMFKVDFGEAASGVSPTSFASGSYDAGDLSGRIAVLGDYVYGGSPSAGAVVHMETTASWNGSGNSFPLTVSHTFGSGKNPFGMFADNLRGNLWVGLTGSSELAVLSQNTSNGLLTLQRTLSMPNVTFISSDDRYVWALSSGSSTVHRINPDTYESVSFSLNGTASPTDKFTRWSTAAWDGAHMWFTCGDTVYRTDPISLQVVNSSSLNAAVLGVDVVEWTAIGSDPSDGNVYAFLTAEVGATTATWCTAVDMKERPLGSMRRKDKKTIETVSLTDDVVVITSGSVVRLPKVAPRGSVFTFMSDNTVFNSGSTNIGSAEIKAEKFLSKSGVTSVRLTEPLQTVSFVRFGDNYYRLGDRGGYTLSFQNSDLVADKLTVSHNLGNRYNLVQVYNNNDVVTSSTSIYADDDMVTTIDFTGMTPLTGEWKVVIR